MTGPLFLITTLIPSHQEICTRNLNSEFEALGSTESIDSAQAATATLHKDWLGIKLGDVGVQKSLSNLFTSKEKLEMKSREALERYYKQGEPSKSDNQADADPDVPDLTYRRVVYQQRQSQEQFLNSMSDRVQVTPMLFVRVFIDLQSQEYGTKHWTAVCDVGMVMESFSSYLRYARSIGARSANN